MNQRTMQFRVGVMVLGTILVAAVLVAIFSGLSSPFRRTYTLEVKFPSAPGVGIGSPVRKSGIRIGEVSKIAFAADDQVLVTLQIDARYRLHDNESCWLRNGLLGDAWLEFEPKQAAGPPVGSMGK